MIFLILLQLNILNVGNSVYSESFKTQQLPYVTLSTDLPDNSSTSALITTNDNLTNGLKFPLSICIYMA